MFVESLRGATCRCQVNDAPSGSGASGDMTQPDLERFRQSIPTPRHMLIGPDQSETGHVPVRQAAVSGCDHLQWKTKRVGRGQEVGQFGRLLSIRRKQRVALAKMVI